MLPQRGGRSWDKAADETAGALFEGGGGGGGATYGSGAICSRLSLFILSGFKKKKSCCIIRAIES